MKSDCQWKKTTKQKNHNHHRIPRTTLKNVHESPLNHKLSIRSIVLCLFIFSIITVFLFSFISFRTLLIKDPNLQSKECRHRISQSQTYDLIQSPLDRCQWAVFLLPSMGLKRASEVSMLHSLYCQKFH